jgi:DNA adenine methylase
VNHIPRSELPRPLVRYHGGKWMLAPRIISQFPEHRCYVEPFGGGGSVLLRKPRSYAEIYNDMDSEMVNLFKVTRDQGAELARLLTLTPFGRDEYLDAWYPSEDPIEQARRTVIRSFMGFGSAAITLMRVPVNKSRGGHAKTGFRSNSNRSGTTPAHDWANYPDCLPVLIERLRGVVIENKDAKAVCLTHDAPTTLHYIDPPYVKKSRSDSGDDYRHEMSDGDHEELSRCLHGLSGTVILSGYHSELYDSLYSDWRFVEMAALADGAKKRTEVLWIKDATMLAIPEEIA